MRANSRLDRLAAHAARVGDLSLPTLIAADPMRATELALRVGPLYLNIARQKFDREAWTALLALAEDAQVEAALGRLFDGAMVNPTESRPALHTALRSDLGATPTAREAHAQARTVRAQMRALAERLRESEVTDIVNVGIGGSDLGPRLAVDALREHADGRFRIHFLSNVDGSAAARLLADLDPRRTAAILVSKSFGTQETLLNGAILRKWLNDDARLFAVSANLERTAAFGIPAERVLPMWDWVGGRYSLWSAVGLSIALAIGESGFDRLLAGAAVVDAHVRQTPLTHNAAVWHALCAVWNRNALGHASVAVLPYDERLALLPAYLQQLVMESLGKSVRLDGTPVEGATVPVLWGGAGTNSQHSFFQALHQGTDTVPADFIGVVRPDHRYRDNHDALLANLLAQTQALANGHDSAAPERRYPGGRPSTTILLDALTPESLGALIALYEHSVYVQSVLWDINPFDQFGVELGKQIANELLPAVRGEASAAPDDPVTAALLAELRARAW